MIFYGGINEKNNVYFVVFFNDKKEQVEIPIDEVTAKRIGMYLGKISESDNPVVERGNDELSD